MASIKKVGQRPNRENGALKAKDIIATQLKALRNARGYTQAMLAERSGLTPQTISKYENGISTPTAEILLDLCHALQTSPNVICGLENDRLFDGLDAKEREILIGLIKMDKKAILRLREHYK